MRLMGANVIKHGKIWDEADEEARKVCKLTDGACYVHPFDDPLVWFVFFLQNQTPTPGFESLCMRSQHVCFVNKKGGSHVND